MTYIIPDRYLPTVGDPELGHVSEPTPFESASLHVIEAIQSSLPVESIWLALEGLALYTNAEDTTVEELTVLFSSENERADQLMTFGAILATCRSFDEKMAVTLHDFFGDTPEDIKWLCMGESYGVKLLGHAQHPRRPASLRNLFPILLA